jgi:hypothetical protein
MEFTMNTQLKAPRRLSTMARRAATTTMATIAASTPVIKEKRSEGGPRMRRKVASLAAGAALITLLSGVALAGSATVASECDLVTGNLVANCGFEADLASWDIAGATGYVDTDGSRARTGSSGLLTHPRVDQSEWVSLSQGLATMPGHHYEVRFFVWHGGSIVAPSLRVEVAGGTAPAGLEIPSGTYYGWWQPLTFEFTAADTLATLTFRFFGSWDMDDVSVYEPLAPVVASQPASGTAVAGTVQQFSAEASGAYVPIVQWQESSDAGSTWSDITGATSRTLSVTAAYGLNGHQYRAVFTNAGGSAASDAATLTVVPEAVTGLSAVFAGGSTTVTFTPAGEPTPTHFQCLTREQRGWTTCRSGDALKGAAKTISVRASWDNVIWGAVATGVVSR